MTTFPDDLRSARTSSLGWLLGYSFALLDRLVVERVRQRHPHFKRALATLTKAMPPEGSARSSVLAERAGVTKQAMSQLVERMTALGYLRARPDPEDGRARVITYSKKGLRLAATIVETAGAFEQECAERIGARRLETTRGVLREVVGMLEEEGKA